MEFGKLVETHRKSAGLGLRGLAEAVGCSTSNISAIEAGRNNLVRSPELVAKLEAALDLAPGELAKHLPVGHIARRLAGLDGSPIAAPPPEILEPVTGWRWVQVVGTVGAGPAQEAETPGEVIPLPAGGPRDVVCYRVRGTSMVGAGIADGVLLLVRRDPAPSPGEQVVAWVSSLGGCVVKTLKGRANPYLQGADGTRIEIDEGDVVYGAVVGRVEYALGVPVGTAKKRK
jgi:SOS-response transcriptional repressor LexA